MDRDKLISSFGFLPSEIRVEPTYETSRENKKYTGVVVIHTPSGMQSTSEDTDSEETNLNTALFQLRLKLTNTNI